MRREQGILRLQAQLTGSMSVWKRIVALPLCACLLASCSMRTVRVQNPVLSVGSSETERLRDLLSRKRIDAFFADGTHLEGRVKEVQDGLLTVDIKNSTGTNPVPLGLQDLPTDRISTVHFTHYKGKKRGSSGKWGGGTWFGAFRIPNLVPRSLVNIVGCSSRGRGNCGKLRAISNWASKPVIRSFPSAVRTVEKQLRALASSPPELLVFPRFA